jgi:hypothetical protein
MKALMAIDGQSTVRPVISGPQLIPKECVRR